MLLFWLLIHPFVHTWHRLGPAWTYSIVGTLLVLLTVHVLVGLPELASACYPQGPITTGLHARLRHPRYVQVALALLGYAPITNYFAGYLVFAAWLVVMYPLVLLEDYFQPAFFCQN